MMIGKFFIVVASVIPLWLAYTWQQRVDSLSQTCPGFGDKQNDEWIEVSLPSHDNKDGMEQLFHIQPCSVFSETYAQARERFRSTAKRIPGAAVYQLPVVVATGRRGTDETMDIAVIPGDQPGLVIHSSGTHGVEGFAGSAIQIAFMETYLDRHDLSSPNATASTAATSSIHSSPTVVLVHAVNPWAMARYRRTNENNVDLNRNALTMEQWRNTARHHINHDLYAKFHSFFNPNIPPMTSTWSYLKWLCEGVVLLLRHGPASFKAAMVGGQYYDPKGISYGGSGKLEPSWKLLEEFLAKFLADRPPNEVVTWIDVHTGLGDMGVDTFLFHPLAYENMEQVQSVVQDVTHHFPGMHTPLAGLSEHAAQVMEGYDNTMGISASYFLKLFSPQQKPLLGAQEFGTVPAVLVGHAVIMENAARQSFSLAEGLVWAQQTTKRVFYPQSRKWRKDVLTRGLRVLRQALLRSSRLSPSLSQV